MTIYAKTRRKYDLTPRQMARFCNLPLSVYYKIEKGMKLEGEEKMFEKFIRNIAVKKVEEMNEEEAVNLKLETIDEENKIIEFFKNFDRVQYFKKFNIKKYEQLAELLDNKYKPDTLMMYICKLKNGEVVNKSAMEDLYDFFTDTNNVQAEDYVGKSRHGKKIVKAEMTEDQIWYKKNLESKLKSLLTKEFGNGQFIGATKNLIDKYPEVNRADISRAIHGTLPGAKLATQLRNIFEQYLVEGKVATPMIEQLTVEEVIETPIVEEVVVPTVEPKEVEKVINEIDEKVTYLTKENEILRDIIKQLPSDVLLGLIISSRMGE